MSIIRATTPCIKIAFKTVNVSDITTAILTLKQKKTTVIEKDLSSATIGESDLTWVLSQAETLELVTGVDVTIVCDWKKADGTRGRSASLTTAVGDPGKNEVI